MAEHTRSRFLFLTLVLLLLIAMAVALGRRQVLPGNPKPDKVLTDVAREVSAIENREQKVAQTVWADELLAEQCGRAFEELWDGINAATNKLAALAAFPLGEIHGPEFKSPKLLAHGIQLLEQSGLRRTWVPESWRQFLRKAEVEGWQLAQAEFRHVQFDPAKGGDPARSRFYFSGHLSNALGPERAIVEGDLLVTWQGMGKGTQPPSVQQIEANHVTVRARAGEPAFREILRETVAPPEGSFFIDPLIAYDLDGDGLPEIILAARNQFLRRSPEGRFEWQPLCRYSPGLIFTGIIADFDGDGAADFLCAKFEGLYLFKGSAAGTFDEPGRLVWAANPHLKYAQTITCGDIDGDGSLDLWLGQYKVPYDRGQMPTPSYDANDGYPSYLLLNDGKGNFRDATLSAGLGARHWRRAYSGSLVDWTGDGRLGLAVVNDFAGLELYSNDGHAHFADVTKEWISENHGFGMSQLWADFNGDGRLDLLMVGMNVPVADRLLHFARARPGSEEYLAMAGSMASGNRLFIRQPERRLQQTPRNDAIARTGWSWGASAFDFDNDGNLDLYIANGHETKQSVRDYETEFWLHDIYVGNSKDNLAALAYFQTKFARTRGRGMSYGGYEKNRLFLNQAGGSFVEAGYLMGVALEQDSRNVLAEDLDGDGRPELLVTTFEAWPEVKQTLRIYRNALAEQGNWIGFRLREQGPGLSPVGARIRIEYGGKHAVRQIVAGDSYRSQRSNVVLFGLGGATRVDAAEIRWLNGRQVILQEPAINQYHSISAPQSGSNAEATPSRSLPP